MATSQRCHLSLVIFKVLLTSEVLLLILHTDIRWRAILVKLLCILAGGIDSVNPPEEENVCANFENRTGSNGRSLR